MCELRARFMAIAADPLIIPGVHQHCDESCNRCHLTDRCLEFRCTNEFRKVNGRKNGEQTFVSIDEAVTFTRDLSSIGGVCTAALDALLGNGPAMPEVTNDTLAVSAWEYAVAVVLAYGPQSLAAADGPPAPGEPSPEENVLWYHLRIYMRIFRAIAAVHGTGLRPENADEALGSAKLAEYSIRRSQQAVMKLAAVPVHASAAALSGKLDAVHCEIRERFPKADAYIRIGMDAAVV